MDLKKLLANPADVRFEDRPKKHDDPAVISRGWIFKDGACFRAEDYTIVTRKDPSFSPLYRSAVRRRALFRIGAVPHTTLLVSRHLSISFLV
jgi:hypothetical protein